MFTEQCEMHHASEITPYIELRLWDDADIPALHRMSDAMKEHGALAGIRQAYSGVNGPTFTPKRCLWPSRRNRPHPHQRSCSSARLADPGHS